MPSTLFIYLFHARMIEYHFNRASPSKVQGTGKYVHFDRYHFNGKYRMRTCLSEYKVRAFPRVWQIELPSLIFGKNVKNTPPTVWQKTWQFLAT